MTQRLLLVIDFINDIVDPLCDSASLSMFVQEREVMLRANQAIAYARQEGVPVVHVKVGFSDDYSECPLTSPVFGGAQQSGRFKLSSLGCEFHADMDVDDQDKVIVKHRISAFYGTDLDVLLRAKRIDELVICGVSTNMTVELTAREAHDRDYRVTVLEDACGAATLEIHQAALKTIARIGRVVSVGDFVSA